MNKQIKDCDTCRHYGKDFKYEEPCKTCVEYDNVNGVPLCWVGKEAKDE